MWELRFVTVHDDGEHVVVVSPDLDGEEFLLPITDELRDALAPPARPARPDPVPDQPLTPREIQARIRAGESAEDLARASGVPFGKVERFAGPVLSERAHVAEEARGARLAWSGGDAGRGTLAEVVTARLDQQGVAPDTVSWDAWRRDDAVWMVQVAYEHGGDRQTAEWSWDPSRRQLRPYGAAGRALSTSAEPEPGPAPERPGTGALRMVGPAQTRPAEPAPAQTLDVTEPAPARPARREEPAETGDGVSRRAVVPSWDDILFGVRRDG